jgi:isochorismate pyruvate lyase
MICKNIREVRNNINNIDEQIVKLIALRGSFVKQAAKFKKDSDSVKAPTRVEEVISKVKNLAKITGANEEVVENVYRTMIDSFINLEMKELESSTIMQKRGRVLGTTKNKNRALLIDVIDIGTKYLSEHALNRLELYDSEFGKNKIEIYDKTELLELEESLKEWFNV